MDHIQISNIKLLLSMKVLALLCRQYCTEMYCGDHGMWTVALDHQHQNN